MNVLGNRRKFCGASGDGLPVDDVGGDGGVGAPVGEELLEGHVCRIPEKYDEIDGEYYYWFIFNAHTNFLPNF